MHERMSGRTDGRIVNELLDEPMLTLPMHRPEAFTRLLDDVPFCEVCHVSLGVSERTAIGAGN